MKTILHAGFAAAVMAVSGPALAQTAGQVFAYLDLDRDAKISLNEYLTFQQPRLAQFDANGDGQLQEREFKASLAPAAQKNAKRSFMGFNRAGNALDQDEFLGYHAFVFKRYVDDDGDGFLSPDEWTKLMEAAAG